MHDVCHYVADTLIGYTSCIYSHYMTGDAGKTASKQLYFNKADKIGFDNCKF